MYEYLVDFKVSKEFEDNGKKHVFYPVTEEDILLAEERMGRKIPDAMKAFYVEIGYGYFEDTSECYIDLLMSPKQIADYVCAEGDYIYAEEREFFKDNEMVFFEVDSNCHIVIKCEGEERGKIYMGNRKIAEDFSEFVNHIFEKSNWYFM